MDGTANYKPVHPLQLGIAIIATLLRAMVCADAADIKYFVGDTANFISVQGEITRGDSDKFDAVTVDPRYKTAVLLGSLGGSVADALEIGETIHRKGYDTFVPDGTTCASACGLIWLSGTTRLISETAQIGFHAAYTGEGASASESGIANALVGAYLNRLGLSYEVVAFVTSAPPNGMRWLHPDDATKMGMKVVALPTDPPAAIPAPPKVSPLSADEQRATFLVQSYYDF